VEGNENLLGPYFVVEPYNPASLVTVTITVYHYNDHHHYHRQDQFSSG